MRLVILPGLDGTLELRATFAELANGTAVAYPRDEVLTFDDYVALAKHHVHEGDVVIAESFSGPIAIRIASQVSLRALILVATFARSPVPRFLTAMPITTLMRMPRPRALLAKWMRTRRDDEMLATYAAAMKTILPKVLASRLRIAIRVDERAWLARTTAPLLLIRARYDTLLGTTQERDIRAARPDADVITIDGPHPLLLAKPREAWRAIDEWLQR